VTPSFFFDTSALIKLYHEEVGTEKVEDIFGRADNSITISEFSIVEFYSTLARKRRTGEIAPQAQEEALKSFEEDCASRFAVAPLTATIVQTAKELLRKHGNSSALRALDALQLAAFLVSRPGEETVFVCADSRLLKICRLEGLEVLNPESRSEK
jgi:predicted nucleic acid-binding protein